MDAQDNKRQQSEGDLASLEAPSLTKSDQIPSPKKDLSSGSGSTQAGIEDLLKQIAAEDSKSEPVVAEKVEEKAPVESASVASTDIASILSSVEKENTVVAPEPIEVPMDIEALLKQVAAEESKSEPAVAEKVEEKPPVESASVASTDIASILSSVEKESTAVAPEPVEAPMDIEALLKQVAAEEPKSEPAVAEEVKEKPPVESASVASTDIASILSSVEKESPVAAPESVKITQDVETLPKQILTEESKVEGTEGVKIPKKESSVISSLKVTKEFDISTDPDVVEMKNRTKEKGEELLKSFVSYKTFSFSFILQIPKVVLRRRKVKQVVRDYLQWVEEEKLKIIAIEDPIKKEVLEKASIVFDQEMSILRRRGMSWMRQGWRKSFLIITWIVAFIVALAIGIPSLMRMYFSTPLRPAVMKEMKGVEGVEAAETASTEASKKDQGPVSYLLLSCEESEIGKLGRIRVYDREGVEVANFPAKINPMKKRLLIQVPAGELGVIIETEGFPIVGVLELSPNQRRFIDLSKWTDPGARATVNIESTPEGIPIICDGAWVGKGFATFYLISGIHKIWASLPNFPPQEQQIMIVDDRELNFKVMVNMGRFVFEVPDRVKKIHPQLKVYVNGSLVLNWESHPVLFGYYTVKVMDMGRVIMQQEVNLEAADEAIFKIQRLEGGQLSSSLASKRNLLKSN